MERIAIFSIRKQQIENGAQPCVDLSELTTLTTDEIIREEYRQNKIPIRIKRPLPNGTFEIWRLADFEIKPIIV
jgi:DNA-directed RNA polymerase subunit K/omega